MRLSKRNNKMCFIDVALTRTLVPPGTPGLSKLSARKFYPKVVRVSRRRSRFSGSFLHAGGFNIYFFLPNYKCHLVHYSFSDVQGHCVGTIINKIFESVTSIGYGNEGGRSCTGVILPSTTSFWHHFVALLLLIFLAWFSFSRLRTSSPQKTSFLILLFWHTRYQ